MPIAGSFGDDASFCLHGLRRNLDQMKVVVVRQPRSRVRGFAGCGVVDDIGMEMGHDLRRMGFGGRIAREKCIE